MALIFNNSSTSKGATIILAGATGSLGGRITWLLLKRGAIVRAVVRPGSAVDKIKALREQGASIVEVDFHNLSALQMPARVGPVWSRPYPGFGK
jgi:NAD(P)-dependent dehydrogenase (short-subunit alcohol dehydrogenase family)